MRQIERYDVKKKLESQNKDGQIEYRRTKQQNKNQNKRVAMKDIKVRYKESRNETEKVDSTVVRMRKTKYE